MAVKLSGVCLCGTVAVWVWVCLVLYIVHTNRQIEINNIKVFVVRLVVLVLRV
jgi:hypothetical protein